MEKNSSIANRLQSRNFNKILYGIPLASLFYSFWVVFRNFIPIRIFFITKGILQLTLTIGYLLFFPILFYLLIKSFKKYYKFLIMIPLLCNSFLWDMHNEELFSSESIIHELQLEEKHYYVVHEKHLSADWPSVYLLRCNSLDFRCESVYGSFRRNSIILDNIENTDIVYIINAGQIDWISEHSYMSWTHLSWDYEFITMEHNFNNHDYQLWVIYSPEQEVMEFVIKRCGPKYESCEILPFRYSIRGLCDEDWLLDCDFGEHYIEWMRFEINSEENELELIIGDELIYTDGSQPRCHAKDCIILGEK